MTELPRIFIVSSSEQRAVAQAIGAALAEPASWAVKVWNEVFDFSASYIESLEAELDRADVAVVVLTGDDAANVRNRSVVLPRDNVIFELGLFIGRLGRERCFFFVEDGTGTQIASDLSGVKPVRYKLQAEPTIATQAERVKLQLRELPPRYKPTPLQRQEQTALWRFSCQVAGTWWERMRRGDDGSSALSLVRLEPDAVSLTPRLNGRAFGLDGEPLARWWSVDSGVLLGTPPKVHFRWEGEHDASVGQVYGGHGSLSFNAALSTAEGYFFDTNFARIHDGAPTVLKRARMLRCTEAEAQAMEDTASPAARALIATKLKDL